jgi:ectoine hydroxylase-related dioxygenase (phytanoyl-CoA dioxygenase family)
MNRSGYLIEEGVFEESECDYLLKVISELKRGSGRAGIRHLMSNSVIRNLALDSRLIKIACTLLGPYVVPFKATLFAKTGKANWLVTWHQDTALPLIDYVDSPEWGAWSRKEGIFYAHAPAWALSRVVALRLHLDAATSRNGPLRVLPGTHTKGVLTDEEIAILVKEQEALECHVSRGGVLAMSPLLVHASSKTEAGIPRRVLHIEYTNSLNLCDGIKLAIA